LKLAVICDLDGTLCDTSHRKHIIEGQDQDTADWDAYSLACDGDTVVEGVAVLVQILAQKGVAIAFASGRSEKARQKTETWLRQHHIAWRSLTMRQEGDYLSNPELKLRVADELEKCGYLVVLVIDDSLKVAAAFKERQIPTLLVSDMTGDLQAVLAGQRIL
jgi:predicted secreted acid phosphatase